ncbi:cytochrome P450, partial [Oryctes borbonicus]
MLATVLLLIFAPFILWVVYYYARVHYWERYLKNVPGPKRTPLLGNGLEFPSSTVFIPKLMEYYNTYNTSFKMYVGSQAYLCIVDPKEMEIIMNHKWTQSKSNLYDYVRNWLGNGLLTASGDRWRQHRKVITPAFHFQILEEFIEVFNSQSDILVSILRKECENGNVDVYPFVGRCTLDILCETAMGTSVNAQSCNDSEYVRCVQLLLEILGLRMFHPFLSNKLLFRFTETYRKERRALKVVHNYTRSIIKRRKEFLKNVERNENAVDSLGEKKRRAFLDVLLEYSAHDPSFTEEDIREEVDTFLFEGHDTTATSISFALDSLARNPDVQIRAYEEIQTIFSDDPKRSATLKDLQEMKYLEMVIKESLRLHTTVPFIGRQVEADMELNGMTLPKGLMVTLFMYGTHHSPKFQEEPEKFNPERYAPGNIKSKHPYDSIPFSAGPRNCIGQKYAMLEMKSSLSV